MICSIHKWTLTWTIIKRCLLAHVFYPCPIRVQYGRKTKSGQETDARGQFPHAVFIGVRVFLIIVAMEDQRLGEFYGVFMLGMRWVVQTKLLAHQLYYFFAVGA